MKFRLIIDVDYKPYNTSESTIRSLLTWAGQHLAGEGMLTGSTNAEVKTWNVTVERLDKKLRAIKSTNKNPTIRAKCYSDDHNIEISFNALEWFKQAEDKEIIALADCEWGKSYEADNVAEYFEDSTTSRLFEYLSIVNQDQTKCGFECECERADALRWLKRNRPEVYKMVCR